MVQRSCRRSPVSPRELFRSDHASSSSPRHRAVAGECRAVFLACFRSVLWHPRQMQQHSKARGTLHQSADGRAAEAEDHILFPVAGHSTVGALGRALTDDYLRRDEAFAASSRASALDAKRPAAAQTSRPLAPQSAAPLNEQRLVDCLVADAHGLVVREVDGQAPCDLFQAPGPRPSSLLPRSMSTPLQWYVGPCNGEAAGRNHHARQPLLHIGLQSQRQANRSPLRPMSSRLLKKSLACPIRS